MDGVDLPLRIAVSVATAGLKRSGGGSLAGRGGRGGRVMFPRLAGILATSLLSEW